MFENQEGLSAKHAKTAKNFNIGLMQPAIKLISAEKEFSEK